MKRTFVTLALCAIGAYTVHSELNSPQSSAQLMDLAVQAYQKKDYAQSADLFAQAIRSSTPISIQDSLIGQASALTQLGKKDEAFAALRQLADSGYYRTKKLSEDAQFKALHTDPRWDELMSAIQVNAGVVSQLAVGPGSEIPYKEKMTVEERICGLTTFWSEVKRSFANFGLVPEANWNELYTKYLPLVMKEEDTYAYYRILRRMCAELHDGHTAVIVPRQALEKYEARPGTEALMVEGRVFILRAGPKAIQAGVTAKQEVIAIDGIPVKEYAQKNIVPYMTASTPQDLEGKVYYDELFSGPIDGKLKLTVKEASGKTKEVTLERLSNEERDKELPPITPYEFKMLDGNIAYVAVNDFGSPAAATSFRKDFEAISKASGLILDVRRNRGGSSLVGAQILQCLASKPFTLGSWRTREYRPTQRVFGNFETLISGPEVVFQPSATMNYKNPVVILTGPLTYSAAETFTLAFDAAGRGKLIGEPTAGSAGNPLFFKIAGGGFGMVATSVETYPDGKRFVGKGIQPTVLVKPTAEDFVKGKDTVLEAAILSLRS